MSAYREALDLLPGTSGGVSDAPAFTDYEDLLPSLEAAMWQDPSEQRIGHFQAFCREMEACAAGEVAGQRHHMVVVVPVADRPQQLAACVDSLVRCQKAFAYAGGVTLLVVEDSLQAAHCEAHRRLLADADGLTSAYLGLDEQRALLLSLDGEAPEAARAWVGESWREGMGHKGASVTRNIAMLWLARQRFERPLFHFIDSDQAFHVDVGAGHPRYMLNYFYHIDRLFRAHDVSVLTGKVVGDPPVSPAVMAGTLLDDVLQVLDEALNDPGQACGFHGESGALGHGAYHDMAGLFGLDNRRDGWRYPCPVSGEHRYADALDALSGRLLRFFDGEHPTRITPFDYMPVEQSLAPARTVYTGNYVIDSDALRHGIPFAPMKLRMAGPTLGRLLQHRLGARFVQANSPLLHRRTEEHTGRAEFRPGVNHTTGQVDLSGEYERQFIGDWMLFSMIELVRQGYPEDVSVPRVDAVLRQVEQRLLGEYAATRACVLERLQRLEAWLDDAAVPWQSGDAIRSAHARLQDFAASVRRNYSEQSPAVQRLADRAVRAGWQARLSAALQAFPSDARNWEAVLRTPFPH